MGIAEAVVAILGSLVDPISKLIENACSDCYDPEVERQELLNIERRLADMRLKSMLNKK